MGNNNEVNNSNKLKDFSKIYHNQSKNESN